MTEATETYRYGTCGAGADTVLLVGDTCSGCGQPLLLSRGHRLEADRGILTPDLARHFRTGTARGCKELRWRHAGRTWHLTVFALIWTAGGVVMTQRDFSAWAVLVAALGLLLLYGALCQALNWQVLTLRRDGTFLMHATPLPEPTVKLRVERVLEVFARLSGGEDSEWSVVARLTDGREKVIASSELGRHAQFIAGWLMTSLEERRDGDFQGSL